MYGLEPLGIRRTLGWRYCWSAVKTLDIINLGSVGSDYQWHIVTLLPALSKSNMYFLHYIFLRCEVWGVRSHCILFYCRILKLYNYTRAIFPLAPQEMWPFAPNTPAWSDLSWWIHQPAPSLLLLDTSLLPPYHFWFIRSGPWYDCYNFNATLEDNILW